MRLLITVLLSLLIANPADANVGCAVPIGGALKNDNLEVWSRLVALSGGKGARWLVFPTASASPEKSAQQIIAALEGQGAKAEMVALSEKLPNNNIATIISDKAWIQKIKTANGIYFAGGAQERITAALLTKDGERTPMLAAIWQMVEAGGVVAGSSAGAAIMSATMFREPPDNLTILRQGAKRGSEIDRGLGFVGHNMLVDQHFLKRGRIGRLLPVMMQEKIALGLGVEENSAAIICGDNVEVIGGRGALLVDARKSHTGAALQPYLPHTPYSASNIALTYLDAGDKINLRTGVVTVSALKLAGNKLDHNQPNFKPYNNSVKFYPDILGDNTIVLAMGALLDSKANETRGLAFATDNDIGFEFRLYKTNDTHGYFSSARGNEDYSIIRMSLDVTPVKMATPLYMPLAVTKTAAKLGENASPADGTPAAPAAPTLQKVK
jgi:cyanophycinase